MTRKILDTSKRTETDRAYGTIIRPRGSIKKYVKVPASAYRFYASGKEEPYKPLENPPSQYIRIKHTRINSKI